jgi:hypothetical protein
VGIMLQYLYTYDIFTFGLSNTTAFQLLIIGDKYEMEEVLDTGLQNLTNKIASLTQYESDWVAEWYPRISQQPQSGTEVLKEQLASVIAKHVKVMIKNDAIKELIKSDGALALVLMEKLASLASAPSETTKESSTPRFSF